MTIPANVQDLLRPEPKRDRWGRYIVAGSKGGKGKGYTRHHHEDVQRRSDLADQTRSPSAAKRPDLIAGPPT